MNEAETPEMLDESTWKEFQGTGLIWWINRMLHLFGWAIVFEVDGEAGEVVRVYPARCKFRGFSAATETEGFHRLTRHLNDEMLTLLHETKPEVPEEDTTEAAPIDCEVAEEILRRELGKLDTSIAGARGTIRGFRVETERERDALAKLTKRRDSLLKVLGGKE